MIITTTNAVTRITCDDGVTEYLHRESGEGLGQWHTRTFLWIADRMGCGHLLAKSVACSACGSSFVPTYLEGIKQWSKNCPRCSLGNLAKFLEDEDPGMTPEELAEGKKAAALLRELIGEKVADT